MDRTEKITIAAISLVILTLGVTFGPAVLQWKLELWQHIIDFIGGLF
jgi:hypothetical protein